MIPALHYAFAILSMENVELLRCIGKYRAALRSVRTIFSALSSSIEEEKASACASNGIGMSLFTPQEAELLNRDFPILLDWADVSAHSKKVLTQLNALLTFNTESSLE